MKTKYGKDHPESIVESVAMASPAGFKGPPPRLTTPPPRPPWAIWRLGPLLRTPERRPSRSEAFPWPPEPASGLPKDEFSSPFNRPGLCRAARPGLQAAPAPLAAHWRPASSPPDLDLPSISRAPVAPQRGQARSPLDLHLLLSLPPPLTFPLSQGLSGPSIRLGQARRAGRQVASAPL